MHSCIKVHCFTNKEISNLQYLVTGIGTSTSNFNCLFDLCIICHSCSHCM